MIQPLKGFDATPKPGRQNERASLYRQWNHHRFH